MATTYQTNTLLSIKIILDLEKKKRTLADALEQYASQYPHRNVLHAITLGTLRHYQLLDHWVRKKCKLKPKDQNIRLLILITLYQCHFMDKKSSRAAIQSAVSCCDALNRQWAKGLVKAVLESSTRTPEAFTTPESLQYSIPRWLKESIEKQYPPARAQAIYQAWLHDRKHVGIRENRPGLRPNTVIPQLEKHPVIYPPANGWPYCAMIPRDQVTTIPGIKDHSLYIQDPTNQMVAQTVPKLQENAKVLDACGAPGGKTGALILQQPHIHITLIDKNEKKLARTHKNLQHFSSQVDILCGDSMNPQSFLPQTAYDCILLDPPCSATATIGQHPEIKLIRDPTDIMALQETQKALWHALWPYLKNEGYLLYSTCSLLEEENHEQLTQLVDQTGDAVICPLTNPITGHISHKGVSISPDPFSHGGYYALVQKRGGKVCG